MPTAHLYLRHLRELERRNGVATGGSTAGIARVQWVSCVGSAAKSGFETTFTAGGFFAYGFVEALDATGRRLGRSIVVATFVPFATTAPTNGTLPANGTALSNSTATRRRRWEYEN